jgi:hypothetical protein
MRTPTRSLAVIATSLDLAEASDHHAGVRR